MRHFFTLIMILFVALETSSQCVLVEVPLQQRSVNSELIIEGRVIAKNSFWNEAHNMIYTSNTVEILKIFKGNATTSTVNILTVGGTVGLKILTTDALLSLENNEVGIFLCETPKEFKALPANTSGIPRYEAYAAKQGFIKYDLAKRTAFDQFHTYTDIVNQLYRFFSPSLNYTEVKHFEFPPQPATGRIAAITSFSPTTITAGTNTVLTINGSGFGTTQGAGFVDFKDADDGGATSTSEANPATPIAPQYISWSDVQIKVEVPTNAGTGTFDVVPGVTFTSSTPLTVSWAHLNVIFDPGGGAGLHPYQIDLIDNNGSGGYTWQMNTNFDANAAANASFMRALNTWRCNTGVNWTIGATTAVNTQGIMSDGTNVVCFDDADPLPSGVLGTCYSWYGGCFIDAVNMVWEVDELDIKFDDGSNIPGFTWQYGPALPTASQYDFESVAVHELGHGLQLGHVIDNSAIMNYSLFNGVAKRLLSTNDLAAGNFVVSKSLVANACGPDPMTLFSGTGCTLPATVTSVKAYEKNNGIEVEWLNLEENNVHHYEVEKSIDGSHFTTAASVTAKSNNNSSTSYDWFDAHVNTGNNYYRIKTVDFRGEVKYTSIVRVIIGKANQSFNIYPNPVNGNSFTAEMYNFKKGVYTLSLYNMGGQQVMSKTIIHTGSNTSETINLPVNIAAGVYRLQLKGDNNTAMQQTLVVNK